MVAGDFNISLSVIDRVSRQKKKNQYEEYLNITIDLTDISQTLYYRTAFFQEEMEYSPR